MDVFPVEIHHKIIEFAALDDIDYSTDTAWSAGALGGRRKPAELVTGKAYEICGPDTFKAFAQSVMDANHARRVSLPSLFSRFSYSMIEQILILTCKLWHGLALKYPYRTALFVVPSSITKFYNVLLKHPNRRSWVRGLFIARSFWRDEHHNLGELLLRLVELLPNLVAFHDYSESAEDKEFCRSLLSTLKTTGTKLKSLSSTQLDKADMVPLITSVLSPSISSLTIFNAYRHPSEGQPGPFIPPSLPALLILRVTSCDDKRARFIGSWSAPSLQHLQLRCDEGIYLSMAHAQPSFGAGLHSLDLSFPYGTQGQEVDMPFILRSCPNLSSFAFSIDWTMTEGTHSTRHDNLEYIGIYGGREFLLQVHPREGFREAADNILWLSRRHFPRLTCVRALCPGLIRAYVNGNADGASAKRDSSREENASNAVCVLAILERQLIEEEIRFEDWRRRFDLKTGRRTCSDSQRWVSSFESVFEQGLRLILKSVAYPPL